MTKIEGILESATEYLHSIAGKWEGLELSIDKNPTKLAFRVVGSVPLPNSDEIYTSHYIIPSEVLIMAHYPEDVLSQAVDHILHELMLQVPLKMVQEKKPKWDSAYPAWASTATNTLSYKDIVNAYQAVIYPTPAVAHQGYTQYNNLKNLLGINKAVGAKDLANHKLPPKEEKILTAEEFYANPPKVEKNAAIAKPLFQTKSIPNMADFANATQTSQLSQHTKKSIKELVNSCKVLYPELNGFKEALNDGYPASENWTDIEVISSKLQVLSKSQPKTTEEAKKKAYLTEELKAAYAAAMHKMAKPVEAAPFQASVDAEMEQLDKAKTPVQNAVVGLAAVEAAFKNAPLMQYLRDQLATKESK